MELAPPFVVRSNGPGRAAWVPQADLVTTTQPSETRDGGRSLRHSAHHGRLPENAEPLGLDAEGDVELATVVAPTQFLCILASQHVADRGRSRPALSPCCHHVTASDRLPGGDRSEKTGSLDRTPLPS